ncbi:hypothetical protein CLV40_105197 [Actinokineospora auranticolor]|uniref:Hydrolytic protein n=1 Tax=Actinokineospora auranticolor TaxID=155976 RepID=A0A2S6GTC1_9PSEU|nr:hypothetical protein CLV40_105197 [Actinokineospora auranticolor]
MTVVPGSEATTTLTVRNDTDIVEAYTFEPVGPCAAWATVEPERLSLYPGTAERVTVRLRPPRTADVRAGENPLGIRVLPVEHPELVTVPETTVVVEPFGSLDAGLRPTRRRTWRSARYQVELANRGNSPTTVTLTPADTGDDPRVRVTPTTVDLRPQDEGAATLRVRTRGIVWFGKSTTYPVRVTATTAEGESRELTGELVRMALLPRWLLALLALLVALLLLWFTLVRPAVRSSAREAAEQAAENKAQEMVQDGQLQPGPSNPAVIGDPGQAQQPGAPGGAQPGGTPGGTGGGVSRQSSGTVEVRTGGGTAGSGTYVVPPGKTFLITDLVLANFQGDEGVLTVVFGDRVITTIALETFRNQDYHWVTPIEITENGAVTANVSCDRPGTPASGRQAQTCVEVLNVSGELRDLPTR